MSKLFCCLVLFVLFFCFASLAYASTDANVDPNGDATVTDAWTITLGTTHYEAINDGVRQPATTGFDGGALYLEYAADRDGNVALSMTTLTDVQQVTAIKVWIYTSNSGGSGTYIDISKDGTTWVGAQFVSYTSGAWVSKTFSGLTWTQTNLDNLQVRLVGSASGASDYETSINAMYATITYEEVVIPEYSLMVFVVVLVASIGIALLVARRVIK